MNVLDEKHLNPLGSKVQFRVMTFAMAFFVIAAALLHEYGDPNDPGTAGGVGWMLIGTAFTFVCVAYEYTIIVRKSRKANSEPGA